MTKHDGSANRSRTIGLLAAALVVVLAVVVYFGFIHPPSGDEVAGTVGAVKK